MRQSEVTVVCTSYNYAQYLEQALDSFLKQETEFPYDILVVDDHSTDHSWEILQDYQARFPEKIRIVQNPENMGLTKTWIEICKQVSAKYIARCDADDYWIDSRKLQKQYDLLESDPNSKWCNTDFDLIDETGFVHYKNVFQNGPIAYANTYEKMFATKGMTLPSSWMVETKMMQEVNDIIDPNSVDDGFPMQLEFFQRTELSFLDDSTVAYRMTSNSDSRPKSMEKIQDRIDGLLQTQLDYLDKFQNADFRKIVDILVRHDANQEARLFEKELHVNHLGIENKQQKQEIQDQYQVIADLQSELENLRRQEESIRNQYKAVITSRRWVLTSKIVNLFKKINEHE